MLTFESSLFQALGSGGRAKTRAREKIREDSGEVGREGAGEGREAVPRLSPPSFFLSLTFPRPQLPRAWNRLV